MSNSGDLLNSMVSTVMCLYIYIVLYIYILFRGFSGSSVVKEYTCNAGDPGLVPGLGRSPGERIGYPL